jgi:hypothetical protein
MLSAFLLSVAAPLTETHKLLKIYVANSFYFLIEESRRNKTVFCDKVQSCCEFLLCRILR